MRAARSTFHEVSAEREQIRAMVDRAFELLWRHVLHGPDLPWRPPTSKVSVRVAISTTASSAQLGDAEKSAALAPDFAGPMFPASDRDG